MEKADLVAQDNNSNGYAIAEQIPHGVFRTYDIRGPVADDSINSNLAYAIGLAFGTMSQAKQMATVIVGRDGRLTGEAIQAGLMAGLLASGCDVIDIGMVASPMLYFATATLAATSGVMVTASHNPAGDNGFKLVLAGETLSSAGVQEIYQRILKREFVHGQGSLGTNDIRDAYIDYILQQIKLDRPLKIVVDCGNGVGAIAGPEIFRRLGCEVVELFCDVDGRFPNHHPDPTVPENLVDIIAAVQSEQADVGLAFDGDADRIGVITSEGQVIWPDRQMMLFAQDVLRRHSGADIIFDVKCSNKLPQQITAAGGNPIMYKTGHSLIKAKMKAIAAPLAGEMSGHIFFNDEWFGFDDGVYVAARLLRILAAGSLSSAAVFAAIPDSVNTPELKLPMPEERKAGFMSQLLACDFADAERITIDGLRVDFGYGWGLVRPSNTSPYLVLRFEADTIENLKRIKTLFAKQLLGIDPDLVLPFAVDD